MQILPRFQNEPGIYVYERNIWSFDDPFAPKIKSTYYPTLDDFFFNHAPHFFGRPYTPFIKALLELHVYDADCKRFASDRLVGLYRQYLAKRAHAWKRSRFSHRNGRKRRAWGRYRTPKTQNERKAYYAHLDDPDAPRPRCCRNPVYLVSSWDDIHACTPKSWKHQSKRRHQWKPRK